MAGQQVAARGQREAGRTGLHHVRPRTPPQVRRRARRAQPPQGHPQPPAIATTHILSVGRGSSNGPAMEEELASAGHQYLATPHVQEHVGYSQANLGWSAAQRWRQQGMQQDQQGFPRWSIAWGSRTAVPLTHVGWEARLKAVTDAEYML